MRTFTNASFLLILSAAVLLAVAGDKIDLSVANCAACIAKKGPSGTSAAIRWCVVTTAGKTFRACMDPTAATGVPKPTECTTGNDTILKAACPNASEGVETQDLTLWGGPNGCGGCLKPGGTKKWCAFADGLHTCVDSANASTDEIYKTCHKEAATVLFPTTTMSCPIDAKKDPLPVHPQHDCGICMEAAKKNNKLVWCVAGDFHGCVDKMAATPKSCMDTKHHMACAAGANDPKNTKKQPTTTATTSAPASSFTAGVSAISIAAAFGAQLLL